MKQIDFCEQILMEHNCEGCGNYPCTFKEELKKAGENKWKK